MTSYPPDPLQKDISMTSFAKSVISITAAIAILVLSIVISGTEACVPKVAPSDAGVAPAIAPALDASVVVTAPKAPAAPDAGAAKTAE